MDYKYIVVSVASMQRLQMWLYIIILAVFSKKKGNESSLGSWSSAVYTESEPDQYGANTEIRE